MTDMKIKLGQAYGFYQMGKRKNQEDARFPDTDIPSPDQRFFIVCDGVGGLDKGEVASSTVAEAIGSYLEQYDLQQPFSMQELSYALGAGYQALDEKNVGANRGMATTLTLLVAHAAGITVAHIGDSRIYQIRPGLNRGGVMYRSYDHSLVNALVRCGSLTPEQAINHPKSNIITRCMGGEETDNRSDATSYCLTDIEPGDVFILCSDGVLHDLTDQDLVDLINEDSSLEDKTRKLALRSESSTDNNTAFLIPVESVNGMDYRQFMEKLAQTPPPVDDGPDESDQVPVTTPISPDTNFVEEVHARQEPPSFGGKVSAWFKKLFILIALFSTALPMLNAQEFISEVPDSIRAIYDRAVAGSADDQNIVGGWYFRGENVELNYPEAVQWWLRAAQGDNPKATGNLGVCYRFGLGVNPDSVRATRLFLKSFKDGNTVLLDSVKAGAERGDVFYNSLLAWKHHSSRGGVDLFSDSAVVYLERAAAAGSVDNMKRLALHLYNRRNYEDSFRWFSAAAPADSVNSMLYVGRMLLEGKGVEQNPELGIEKIRIAARAGNRNALYTLGQCYSTGTGVEEYPALALKFYTLASGKGLGRASWDAARCYMDGIGTQVDIPLASIFFSRYVTQASPERFRKLINDTIPDSPLAYYLKGTREAMDNNFELALDYYAMLERTQPALGKFMGLLVQVKTTSDQDSLSAYLLPMAELTAELPYAQFLMGKVLQESMPQESVTLLTSAAESGFFLAAAELGAMYFTGTGVEQNYDTAVLWLYSAMEVGLLNSEQAAMLARCYEEGLGGLTPDPQMAEQLRSGLYTVDTRKILEYI